MADLKSSTSDPDPDPMAMLIAIMAQLRNPAGGCPWDLTQNFATIAPYTIEEAYEVADAIERRDMAALKDELGDLLLQVVFHAQMAQEAGLFKFSDVAKAISDKMIRRHPHVFGEKEIESATEQTKAWEEQKETERRDMARNSGYAHSVLNGIASSLPSLTKAMKLQRRAARVGFDWTSSHNVILKILEELVELKPEIKNTLTGAADRKKDEVGDLLFSAVNLARHLDVDPDQALRHANAKFERRFRWLEQNLIEQGLSVASASLDEMEALWRLAKIEEDAIEKSET